MESAVSHLKHQLEVEVGRWRMEADRADSFEGKCSEYETMIAELERVVAQLQEQLISGKKSLGDIYSQFDVTQKDLKFKSVENLRLLNETNNLRNHSELVSSRLEALIGIKSEQEKKISDLSAELNLMREAKDKSTQKEILSKVQLDMQTHLNREIETRLEQALLGWKMAKNSEQKMQQRLTDIKARMAEQQGVVIGLQRENVKLENRLKLYDALPLPDQIHMRFKDIEDDRYSLKELVEQLAEQLKLNVETVKIQTNEISRLQHEENEMSNKYNELSGKYMDKSNQCSSLISELTLLRGELSSVRESLKVCELDNAELIRSEAVIKKHLLEIEKKNDDRCITHSGDNDYHSIATIDTAIKLDHDEESVVSPFRSSEANIDSRSNQSNNEENSQERIDDTEEETSRVQDRLAKAKIQRLLDGPNPGEILDLFFTNIHNESMVWRCMRSLRTLILTDDEFKKKCVTKLLDYMVMQCMIQYMNSVTVQSNSMRLLASLAFGNDKVRRRLGEEGLMRVLVSTMDNYFSDESIQLYGLMTVTNMAHGSFENGLRFCESSGIDLAVRLLEYHKNDAKIQTHGCWVFLTLAADDRLSRRLIEKGITAVVANAMVVHRADAHVQRFACLAFVNLALAGDQILKQLKGSGIHELFRIAIETFRGDINVVNAATRALQSLEQ